MEEDKINEETQRVPTEQMTNDELQEAVKTELEKVRMAGLLSGAKAICGVILEDIAKFKMEPGKKTFRQQERLIKQIQDFCQVSLSRTINENGEIVSVNESKADQDNTKLFGENNEKV